MTSGGGKVPVLEAQKQINNLHSPVWRATQFFMKKIFTSVVGKRNISFGSQKNVPSERISHFTAIRPGEGSEFCKNYRNMQYITNKVSDPGSHQREKNHH